MSLFKNIDSLNKTLKDTFGDEVALNIINKFWFKDAYAPLIAIPAFLDILLEYQSDKHATPFNIYDYYTYLFTKLTPDPDIYRQLKDLALVFERTHSIGLSEEHLAEALAKRSPNISKKQLLDWQLFEIDEKTNEHRWVHHRLSEFLVAAKFVEETDTTSLFKEHAFIKTDTNTTAFKPSWAGVLYFLLNSPKSDEVIEWLISFIAAENVSLDEDLAEYLANVAPNIKAENKELICNLVFNTYTNEKEIWLPVWSRRGLGRLATLKFVETLRAATNIDPKKDENCIIRGNASMVIDSVLDEQPLLLSKPDKQWWKTKLISFAQLKTENGILERESLSALAHYKDPEILPQVSNNFNSKDSLVRDQFIQFCYENSPNSIDAVDYMIKGIQSGITIYGRHGLYEVKEKAPLLHFIQQLTDDDSFLVEFLEGESIFNGDDEKGDQILIEHIGDILDANVVDKLSILISTAAENDKIYHLEQSYFMKSLIKLVESYKPDFWKEVLNNIKVKAVNEDKAWHLIYNFQPILELVVTQDNVTSFSELLSKIHPKGSVLLGWVLQRKASLDKSEELLDYAVTNNLIPKFEKYDDTAEKREVENRKKSLYIEFKKHLEPAPGQYMTDIFEFYLNNKDKLQDFIQETDTARLKELVLNSGLKINPKDIHVNYHDKTTKKGPYNITTTSHVYGDVLKLTKLFFPDKLSEYRQNIIDFIPYAYTEDLMTVLNIVDNVTDAELTYVNSVFADTTNDARYLIPSSYIYFIEKNAENGIYLGSVIPNLKSFMSDPLLEDYVKKETINVLGLLAGHSGELSADFFQDIFDKSPTSTDIDNNIKEKANRVLIEVFRDETANKWRIKEIKTTLLEMARAYKPAQPSEVHTVGDFENELSVLAFANPITRLGCEYSDELKKLLEFSFTLSDTAEYKSYVVYIWSIYRSYLSKPKPCSKELFRDTENLLKHYKSNYPYSKWFNQFIEETKKNTVNTEGKLSFEKALTYEPLKKTKESLDIRLERCNNLNGVDKINYVLTDLADIDEELLKDLDIKYAGLILILENLKIITKDTSGKYCRHGDLPIVRLSNQDLANRLTSFFWENNHKKAIYQQTMGTIDTNDHLSINKNGRDFLPQYIAGFFSFIGEIELVTDSSNVIYHPSANNIVTKIVTTSFKSRQDYDVPVAVYNNKVNSIFTKIDQNSGTVVKNPKDSPVTVLNGGSVEAPVTNNVKTKSSTSSSLLQLIFFIVVLCGIILIVAYFLKTEPNVIPTVLKLLQIKN